MKTGRVALLFAYAFGSIIIPVVVLMLVALLTYKTPYIIQPSLEAKVESWPKLAEDVKDVKNVGFKSIREYPGADRVMYLGFENGGQAFIIHYASKSEAGNNKIDVLDKVPTNSVTSAIDLLTYQRSDNQAYGMLFQNGAWVVISEAPTKGGRNSQLEGLPFLVKQKMSLMSRLFEDHLGLFFAGMGLYLLFLLVSWPRMASWAAKVEAVPGAPKLETELLKQRLMSINSQDVPFGIQQGKRENEFIVEWKYVDAKWVGLMAAGGVKSLARIRMRLDPDKKQVRALDSNSTVRWRGQGSQAGLSASLSWSWFRGIEFYNYSREKIYGFLFKGDKLTFDQAYEYTFSRSEMKAPVIEIVTGSGWTYQPVVSFLWPFS